MTLRGVDEVLGRAADTGWARAAGWCAVLGWCGYVLVRLLP